MKKLYRGISEVSRIVDLEEYVIRYWEKEFGLKILRATSGYRRFTEKDIKDIIRIKCLLRDDRYTIEGAKIKLAETKK